MNIKGRVYFVLAPVFGDDLYRGFLPDKDAERLAKTGGAFGVLSTVGGQSYQSIEGDIDLTQPRVQLSIFTTSEADRERLQAAVDAVMKTANQAALTTLQTGGDPLATDGAILNYSPSVPVDGYDSETRRYYVHMDFICWS